MFRRTRWHLVGWNVLILAVILTLVGGAVYLIVRDQLTANVDQQLLTRSQAPLGGPRGPGPEPGTSPSAGPVGYSGGFFSLVLAPDGQVRDNPQQVSLTLDPTTLHPPEYLTVTVNNEPARIYVTTPPLDQRGGSFLLVVGESLAPVQQALRRLAAGLLLGGAAGLLLSFLGAWFLAGRALVPIEFAFRRQQEFVADASHELRTPLTVLRASADLLNQHRTEPLDANGQLFDDFRHELERLERLANDLLLLARADLGEVDLAVAPVDLGLLADEVVRRTLALARTRLVALAFAGADQDLTVEVDPDRIQQVLLILIDNALKHTPAGGTVTVGVQRQGGDAILSVRDTGEGIASEHLPRLFDRFYRVDRARTHVDVGAGLGLPIARSLVEAHGGHLSLSSVPGVGTVVTIRLPLAHSAPSLSDRLGRLAVRAGHGLEQEHEHE
ncbi:MAG TPA: HAMP domain-containing sensor histidine kinase [Thermomicrobiaceae bacterium]|nr:HAMP domain-containing sensor histidine kinase [Thermomicrobiaceae bacterium]